MPALFVLFFVLIVRALTLDGAGEGVRFFLQPDFSHVTSEVILYAMGQSFFSLSVGVAVMVTYSSYLPKEESLPRSAFSIVALTLVITLLAGLAIFPVVFAFGMEPSQYGYYLSYCQLFSVKWHSENYSSSFSYYYSSLLLLHQQFRC